MIPASFRLPLITGAMLLINSCAYDGATGYAPEGYPVGYDAGMGSGLVSQPGDRFGSQNVASIDAFTAELAPYGQWVDSKFGRAFRPDVSQDWRPYVNGGWGENRLWISNDPWGWATDHYGRWGFDDRIGWVWAPGTEWAPSWVAWREDSARNVAGWAPVPPGVNYSLNLGFGNGFGYDNYDSWYGPSWVWVPQNYLYQPGFGGRVLPWRYGANYWGGSRWQYQPGFSGRPAQGGNWHGHPSQGGNYQGQPPRGGYGQQRPPQGGSWQGRPLQDGGNYPDQGGDRSRGISNVIANGLAGSPRPGDERPVMTYSDRPNPSRQTIPGFVPAPQQPESQSQPQRPQRIERPAGAQPQPRIERQELQREMQAQSTRRNDEGNTRPQ